MTPTWSTPRRARTLFDASPPPTPNERITAVTRPLNSSKRGDHVKPPPALEVRSTGTLTWTPENAAATWCVEAACSSANTASFTSSGSDVGLRTNASACALTSLISEAVNALEPPGDHSTASREISRAAAHESAHAFGSLDVCAEGSRNKV